MKLITDTLTQIREQNLWRGFRQVDGMNFSSNDYLGLAHSVEVRAQLMQLLDTVALGATGSRLLTGHTKWHEEVEAEFCNDWQVPSCLLMSSGYMANLSVLSAFASMPVVFYSDELNHASLIDGMRLSGCKKNIYRHCDIEHLRELLLQHQEKSKPIIVTESVFSMDGDLAPLTEIVSLAEEFDALLIVDEAHATGVFGFEGRGLLHHRHDTVMSIHPCGKALGVSGAFVLSSQNIRDLIINRSRPFIFSTAMTPLQAMHIACAWRVVKQAESVREKLRQNINQLNQAFALKNESPIFSLPVKGEEACVAASQKLQQKGIDLRAIRWPTVSKGRERLRLTLRSEHTAKQIDYLVKALQDVGIFCYRN